MASCMECIHFNPCNSHGKIIVEKPTEGNDWGLHDNVENECKYFTPTADVVEVVRCKDCVYGREIDKEKSPEKYFKSNCIVCECEDVVGDEPAIYLPNHFCSYGERRDT